MAEVQEIEQLIECQLPDDFREFLLEYSCVAPTPSNNCSSFKVDYEFETKIEVSWSLIESASYIIRAIHGYRNPSPFNEEIGPLLPQNLLPLSNSNEWSLLIDLRKTSFGNILFHPDLSVWTFGTPMNDWHSIGYVADNLISFLKDLDSSKVIAQRYNLPEPF